MNNISLSGKPSSRAAAKAPGHRRSLTVTLSWTMLTTRLRFSSRSSAVQNRRSLQRDSGAVGQRLGRFVCKTVMLAVATTVASAQQDPPTPTFSTATKLVQVDVVARGQGAPAAGLTKEDFTVLDNGNPQKISFFSVRSPFSVRSATSGAASAPAAGPLPPGAVSNRMEREGEASANATVVLIDQVNTPPAVQAFAIPRVAKFVQMRRKGDRAGIYTFSADGLRAVQDITDDTELLGRAVNSLKARDPIQRSRDTAGMTAHAAENHNAMEVTSRAMEFKTVLEAIARHLASVPGRKNLIWVTTSFPLFWPEEPPQQPIVDFRPEMEQAAHALNDADIALYAVDARGLMGALSGLTAIRNAEFGGPRSPAELRMQMHQGEPISPAGLNTENFLAGLTGGLVFYNKSNAIEESIQTAADDGELTYTLGFYPAQERQDGTRHKLKVEVARRGVSLRYRESYFAATAASANQRPTALARTTDLQPVRSLEQLLKDPLDATQLELIAEATADPARPGSWQVRASVDLHGVQLEHENNTFVGTVDFSFMIEGSRTARTLTTKLTIPEDQLAAALEKGMAVNDSIALVGQAGELRIVAQDRATGAAGSVRVPLGRK